MSLFPFVEQKESVVITEKKVTVPTEYEVNFETGKLTGRIVHGKEAIKIWVHKVLLTNRYDYLIYSWDYGVEIESLISKSFDRGYIESELQRYIKEALLINEHIKDVTNFSVCFEGTWLICDFSVITDFGEVKIHDKYTKL